MPERKLGDVLEKALIEAADDYGYFSGPNDDVSDEDFVTVLHRSWTVDARIDLDRAAKLFLHALQEINNETPSISSPSP